MSKQTVKQDTRSFYDECYFIFITLFVCILICISIGVIIGLLIWNIFVIKSLIETTIDDITNICNKSGLWYYNAIIMINNLLLFIYTISSFKTKITKENIVCILSYIYITSIIFSTWGSLEIFGHSCPSKLTNTLLYKLGYVILIFQYILFIILPIVIIVYLCKKIPISKDNNIEL